MKIALIGSSGYISSFLIDRFSNNNKIIKIDKNDDADYYLDLERINDFDFEVIKNVDYVIFPAAISSPDLCEKEYDMCWKINVEGTSEFIEKALLYNCRVIFFSSDAVFGDYPDNIFDENSPTRASSAYGKMKKAIEDRFKDNQNFKAIRLSYVVSDQDKFTRYVLGCLQRNELCEVYDPFYRNCITVNDVLDCIEYLMNHWKEFEPVFLNIAGKDLISREDIVKELIRILGKEIKYTVIYPGEDFYSCRPKITRMTSRYLKSYNILPEESFSEKMSKVFRLNKTI